MADGPSSNTPQASAAMAQSRTGSGRGKRRRHALGRAREGVDFTIGTRVARAVDCRTYDRERDDPVFRPLRIYALDPTASVLDGALAVVNVPYEPIERGPRGPRGNLLEIVDDGPAGVAAPDALNLEAREVLILQGRYASPEDPYFRQQMAYAVCTTTYAAFRQALGRDVAWGFTRKAGESSARLRVRPSVADLRNAFYDNARGELQFGVFSAGAMVVGRNVPGGLISLSLSHDIVVHEMSHALLDGLRSHFLHPSNADVLAFHEAFADLIAIFQRFTYRDVVLSAIRRARGTLAAATLLTDIAVQFAQAMEARSALRSAVGGTDRRYGDAIEPHQRGEVLVAAVFRAFDTIYQRKVAPLLRLATDGTGELPPGQIPDVLAEALTDRACKLAAQFLSVCIRAIDYCPPVDITFGEYLRAVITADSDVAPHDEWGYREAWLDAFTYYQIYPRDVRSLSQDALVWRPPQEDIPPEPELSFAELGFEGDPGRAASTDELMRQARRFGRLAADKRYRAAFGLAHPRDPRLGGDRVDLPVVESIRSTRRVGPNGQVVFDLVAEITQRRFVAARGDEQDRELGFNFYGGATAILDPTGRIRLVIRKSILDVDRLTRQRQFVNGDGRGYFGIAPSNTLLPETKLLLKLHDVTRPELRGVIREVASAATATPAARGDGGGLLLRLGDTGTAVSLLKACLNRAWPDSPHLDDSPTFDQPTQLAVSRLQMEYNASVDGLVGPQTWTLTGRRLKYQLQDLPLTEKTPRWIANLLANDPATTTLDTLDVSEAVDFYGLVNGALSASRRKGLLDLLGYIIADQAIVDLRWAAYMLATVKHECAETWQPIEEFGKGAGRAYGKPVTVTDGAGRTYTNVYYGRGYVQLTWKDNYLTIGQALGLNDALMLHPERVLESKTAYDIMSHGMRHGSFTGRGLSRYITGPEADYRNARRIINGLDQADTIAAYAQRMETMLLAHVPRRVIA